MVQEWGGRGNISVYYGHAPKLGIIIIIDYYNYLPGTLICAFSPLLLWIF